MDTGGKGLQEAEDLVQLWMCTVALRLKLTLRAGDFDSA